MALRDDLEGICGSILHRSSVDSIVSELLAEEIRLNSHKGKISLSTSTTSVLAIPSRPLTQNHIRSYLRVVNNE